jgi:hypothetical protein
MATTAAKRGNQESRLKWHIFTAPKESGRALARRLGVSHTYVRKLVRKLPGEPPWPRVPIQEVETPWADAPEELEHEQSVSPTRKPKLDDVASEAREERLREYGEFIARRCPACGAGFLAAHGLCRRRIPVASYADRLEHDKRDQFRRRTSASPCQTISKMGRREDALIGCFAPVSSAKIHSIL